MSVCTNDTGSCAPASACVSQALSLEREVTLAEELEGQAVELACQALELELELAGHLSSEAFQSLLDELLHSSCQAPRQAIDAQGQKG